MQVRNLPQTLSAISLYLQKLRPLSARAPVATLALVTLLQKSPALVRVANALPPSIEPVVRIVQKATVALATLGSYHAVSGATPASYSAATDSGESFSDVQSAELPLDPSAAFQIVFGLTRVDGARRTPGSWSVTGEIPPGMTAAGVQGSNEFPMNAEGVFNAANGTVYGEPTQSGTFVSHFKPWENQNASGRTADAFTLTLNVEAVDVTLSAPNASIAETEKQFVVTWSIQAGQSYELQTSDNPLDPDSWSPLPIAIEASAGQQSASIEKESISGTLLLRVTTQPKP